MHPHALLASSFLVPVYFRPCLFWSVIVVCLSFLDWACVIVRFVVCDLYCAFAMHDNLICAILPGRYSIIHAWCVTVCVFMFDMV